MSLQTSVAILYPRREFPSLDLRDSRDLLLGQIDAALVWKDLGGDGLQRNGRTTAMMMAVAVAVLLLLTGYPSGNGGGSNGGGYHLHA